MRDRFDPAFATWLALALATACSGGGGGGTGAGGTTTPDIVVTDSLAAADDHALPFGSAGVGVTQDATVTVSNAGDASLVVGTVGAPPAPFSKATDACSGQTLAPGASCSVTIRFAPTALTASSGTFAIPSNDPDSPAVAMSVSGNGRIHLTALAGYQRVVLTFTWIDPAERDGGYNVYTSEDGTTWTKNVSTSFLSRYAHEGLTTGTTYFYKVSKTDGGVESEASAVVQATPRPAVAAMTWTFDDGTLQGWTRGGAVSRWNVTSGKFHSASWSVTDSPSGNYLANDVSWLASPTLDLSVTTAPTLNYWRSIATEAFDICIVEVSGNGGTSFTSVDQANGYEDFTPVTVDLSPYATSTQAVVRFRIDTDGSINADGCYYDDVVITE